MDLLSESRTRQPGKPAELFESWRPPKFSATTDPSRDFDETPDDSFENIHEVAPTFSEFLGPVSPG